MNGHVSDDVLVGRYLSGADMRRLSGVGFCSRRMMRGRYAGGHATKQRGYSTEFIDYREYVAGDDMGKVDWKVYGRSDRLYVKSYEHQARMTGHLVVDGSASMKFAGFGGGEGGKSWGGVGESKFDVACRVAGAIGYLLVRQGDRISMSIARDGLARFSGVGGGVGQLIGGVKMLDGFECGGLAGLGEGLFELADKVERQGVVMVFSDLLDGQEGIARAIAAHCQRGSEVILFHVLHDDEMRLGDVVGGAGGGFGGGGSGGGRVEFLDIETGRRVRVGGGGIVEGYERKVQEFIKGWQEVCDGRGIDYNVVTTGGGYMRTLKRYLIKRESGR